MRTFLSWPNLVKALGMSATVTAMSAAWIVRSGIMPGILIPASFVLMTFVCGAVTAWGNSARMPGVATDRQTFLRGTTVAVAVSTVALPVQVFWTDPIIHKALLASAKPWVVDLAYPTTLSGCVALLLWTVGFQTMFLQAAPMSFFARLLNRQYLAVGFCLVFRAYVAHRQIVDHGMSDAVPLFLISNVLGTAAGCVVFARFGLLPAIFLSSGLSLHLFVSSPTE